MTEEVITVGDMMDTLEKIAKRSMDYEAKVVRQAAAIVFGYAKLANLDPEFHKFVADRRAKKQ